MASIPFNFLAAMLLMCVFASGVEAREWHVAVSGSDANAGTADAPLRTIQHAADLAQPGDVVTVHAGIYREQVTPSRGGTSDAQRITYQAAPGEKVVITGSDVIKGWEFVGGDTWKVTIPNKYFGEFNPYSDLIHGDWYDTKRPNHTGMVYLDGKWMSEATGPDQVLAPIGEEPLWYATVDGAPSGDFLVNIATFQIGNGPTLPAAQTSAKSGTQTAPCSEGGECVGFIHDGDWLRYDNVDFGSGADAVSLRVASVAASSDIEIHLDSADGKLLGTARATRTGDWQKWTSVEAKIAPTSGQHTLCLVIKTPHSETDNTTIWAQFMNMNPNEADVEINVRQTVFTPQKTGINYITLRGFTLRNAATNWAPPDVGQMGLVTAYWCKGWIIEDNDIAYSRCCGIALGKYGDAADTAAKASAESYTDCVRRALDHGWNEATVGSHVVRNNRIAYCGQTGIVGSMGCAFSTVTGNEIHDIHVHQPFGGAEMAGIKFHGGIDVTISNNHVYRCGSEGLWLDWMGQGAHITGNLMHHNIHDIFLEMQHGPILVANNLLLSNGSFLLNAQGVALAHNLILGRIDSIRGDRRSTPYQQAHATAIAGMYPCPEGDSGDDRLYNNLVAGSCDASSLDNSALPCFAGGNVFAGLAQPSNLDGSAVVKPEFDVSGYLEQKSDGWYLTINEDDSWRDEARRKVVTTELLGSAKVTGEAFENADGSPLKIGTDYFGKKRDAANPYPGPFEIRDGGKRTIKVWPKDEAGSG